VDLLARRRGRADQADQPEPDRHARRLPPVRLFNMLVMEPGSLIMERKMLLGIKQRAEDLAREQISRM
jgi:hypothetical protein